MIDNFDNTIETFNKENLKFGDVDVDTVKNESNDYQLLYYYYPMIERLFRNILDTEEVFNLDNIRSDTFKTLKSIIENNEEQIVSVFDKEFGDELLYYLKETYFDDGIRNTIMHYNKENLKLMNHVLYPQNIFFLN